MVVCKLEGCPYKTDGRCIENQLPDCPNLFDDETEEAEVSQETDTAEVDTPKFASFYRGEKLTPEQTSSILQQQECRTIVLGGMIESGKSTLIARCFEMFQNGPLAGYRFAGSRTLPEFERLSWHSTMESGGESPTTEHTYRSENNRFLHLCVEEIEGTRNRVDIVIADIPGEIFPEAASEERVCRDLLALGAAAHLVMFLDAKILLDDGERYEHSGQTFDFLTRGLDTRQIGLHTALHIVIAKSDCLAIGNVQGMTEYIDGLKADVLEEFGVKFGSVKFWQVAPRPEGNAEPTLATITELFASLMTKSSHKARHPIGIRPDRDYCRYVFRP